MPEYRRVLETAFHREEDRYFRVLYLGRTPKNANPGVEAVLSGEGATSAPQWDTPAGSMPYAGALSGLIDGVKVETVPFRDVDEWFARASGEGDLSLAAWREAIDCCYRVKAECMGHELSDDTPMICEWFRVARRLSSPPPPETAKHSGSESAS